MFRSSTHPFNVPHVHNSWNLVPVSLSPKCHHYPRTDNLIIDILKASTSGSILDPDPCARSVRASVSVSLAGPIATDANTTRWAFDAHRSKLSNMASSAALLSQQATRNLFSSTLQPRYTIPPVPWTPDPAGSASYYPEIRKGGRRQAKSAPAERSIGSFFFSCKGRSNRRPISGRCFVLVCWQTKFNCRNLFLSKVVLDAKNSLIGQIFFSFHLLGQAIKRNSFARILGQRVKLCSKMNQSILHLITDVGRRRRGKRAGGFIISHLIRKSRPAPCGV